jgi:hypothetical protein
MPVSSLFVEVSREFGLILQLLYRTNAKQSPARFKAFDSFSWRSWRLGGSKNKNVR